MSIETELEVSDRVVSAIAAVADMVPAELDEAFGEAVAELVAASSDLLASVYETGVEDGVIEQTDVPEDLTADAEMEGEAE